MPESPGSAIIRRALAAGFVLVCGLAVAIAGGVFGQVSPFRLEREVARILDTREISREALDQAEGLTSRSLDQRALDGSAWLRLAFIRRLGNGQLDIRANQAIEMSYAAEPLGPEVTAWRLAFIFDHWASASMAVRTLALRELEHAYPRRGWDFDGLALTLRDPTGRMIAVVATRRLRQAEQNKRGFESQREEAGQGL